MVFFSCHGWLLKGVLRVFISNMESMLHVTHRVCMTPLTDHTMVVFTDGSAQGNSGPVGGGIVIKEQSLQSSLIKLAKAIITPYGSEGEFEAIRLGTDFLLLKI